MRTSLGRFDIRVSVVYGTVAALWIIFSDILTSWIFAGNVMQTETVGILKGLLFVAVTTLALYSVLHRELKKRTRVKEALQASENRYRHMVEDQIDPVCHYRSDFKLTFVNQAYAQLFAKSPDALIGTSIFDLIPSEEQEQVRNHLSAIGTSQQIATSEYRMVAADGSVRWFHWKDRAILNAQNEIIEYQGVGRDITSRKQVEEAESEQRRLADALRESLFSLTSSLNVNEIMEHLLEYAAAVVPYDAGSIILFEGNQGRVAYLRGFPDHAESFFKDYRFSLEKSKYWKLRQNKEAYLITDTKLKDDWESLPITDWIRSTIGVPIEIRGGIIGLLAVDSATPFRFQQKDVENLRLFAQYASLALENAYDVSALEKKVSERTAELNHAKERVEAILNNSLEGIVLARTDLHIAQANAAFNTLFTCPIDSYFDHSLLDLIHESDTKRIAEALQGVIREHSGTRFEACALRRDETTFNAEISVGYIKAKYNRAASLVCTIRDITERKEQERQLRFHASLQETVTDAVIATDMELRIQSWNRGAEVTYGWRRDEVIGKNSSHILQTQFDDESERSRIMQQLLNQGYAKSEVEQSRKDGSKVYIMGAIGLFRDENGIPIGIVAVNRDITESNKVKQALKAQQEQEREFQKYLKALHEVTLELTQIDHLDDFYKRAVQLGLQRLGFERLALLLYDGQQVIGTYGTDTQGNITNEHNFRSAPKPDGILERAIGRSERFCVDEDTLLYTNGEEVGHGWNAAAVLWNGAQSLGWLVADNAITHKPASKPLLDILALYSLTIGSLLAQKQIEAALRTSEEKFRRLMEGAPEAIVISDKNGTIVIVNDQAEKLTGYQRSELIGQTIEILVVDHLRDQHEQNRMDFKEVPHARALGAVPEVSVRRKDGTTFQAEIALSYIETEDDLLVMSFIVDITERTQAQERLAEERNLLRTLIDTIPDFIYIKDLQHRFILTNVAHALARRNSDPNNLIGKSDFDYFPQEMAEQFEAEEAEIFRTGKPLLNYEQPSMGQGGVMIWASSNKVPLRNLDNQIIGLVGVTRDITESKRNEEALRESEERYRWLIETMQGGAAMYDTDERITYVNDRFCKLLGYTREELLGTRSYDYVDQSYQQIIEEQVNLRKQAENTSYELVARRKDGQAIYLLVAGSPLLDKNGNYSGSFAITTDITAQKQAEAALRQALETEKELGELKSRFVSMASHEFRTPLATILATSETLIAYREKLSEEQVAQKLNRIQEQVLHLKEIMDDVLQITRMQMGRAEFNPDTIDLDELFRDIVDEFQNHPEMNHQLIYTCAQSPLKLNLDKKLMRQVVSNLISNAIKYSPGKANVFVDVKSGSAVTIDIRDEGIGIPEADLKHLFEPFHRATNVGTISGTGLGLVIAKHAVELHGGTMTVESAVNAGTTFHVSLPLQTAEMHSTAHIPS